MSRDTWPAPPDTSIDVEAILQWLSSHPDIDGVTISGGEPLDQLEDLIELVTGIRELYPRDVDILCYTGRTTAAAKGTAPQIFRLVDAMATGPYVAGAPSSHPILGSGNQELIPLTALGRQRYSSAWSSSERALQGSVIGGRLLLIGVPHKDDLLALETAAEALGIGLSDPSWREPQS